MAWESGAAGTDLHIGFIVNHKIQGLRLHILICDNMLPARCGGGWEEKGYTFR